MWVDCHGRCFRPEVVARPGEGRVHFVYDEDRKAGVDFSCAVFVDDAARSRRYLRYPRSRRVWLLQETPIRAIYADALRLSSRFSHVFTHWQPLIQRGAPFQKFYFGTSWLGGADTSGTFEKSRDVSFIGSVLHGDNDGYELRKRVASALMDDGRIDCFGYGIQEIPSKLAGLADYRFSIALENTRQDYYFSEKLIDCFLTDTVPVYWGCPGLGDIFDVRGVVRFDDVEDLLALIDTLDADLYDRMLPFVRANKQLAIEERLDTLQGQHERLAEELVERIGWVEPVRVRPRLVGWCT